ncbi:MAG: hypothetical protein EOP53_10685 [Sphingobacteriales bacterium]|nr:MAG: hypothetical protein EOP53_10685 [Sphingobacteriales bacterium]
MKVIRSILILASIIYLAFAFLGEVVLESDGKRYLNFISTIKSNYGLKLMYARILQVLSALYLILVSIKYWNTIENSFKWIYKKI